MNVVRIHTPSHTAVETVVGQIEHLVRTGDLDRAHVAFELTTGGVIEFADAGQLDRLRSAATTLGIDFGEFDVSETDGASGPGPRR